MVFFGVTPKGAFQRPKLQKVGQRCHRCYLIADESLIFYLHGWWIRMVNVDTFVANIPYMNAMENHMKHHKELE